MRSMCSWGAICIYESGDGKLEARGKKVFWSSENYLEQRLTHLKSSLKVRKSLIR